MKIIIICKNLIQVLSVLVGKMSVCVPSTVGCALHRCCTVWLPYFSNKSNDEVELHEKPTRMSLKLRFVPHKIWLSHAKTIRFRKTNEILLKSSFSGCLIASSSVCNGASQLSSHLFLKLKSDALSAVLSVSVILISDIAVALLVDLF